MLKCEILGFAGSDFKDFPLKSARQAPAATAWEKKKQRVNEQRVNEQHVNEQRVNEQHVNEHHVNEPHFTHSFAHSFF